MIRLLYSDPFFENPLEIVYILYILVYLYIYYIYIFIYLYSLYFMKSIQSKKSLSIFI